MSHSREQLERIIKAGGSVIISSSQGAPRVVTRIEDLPSPVELAGDDIVKKQAAMGDLQKQIDELIRQQKQAEAAIQASIDPPAPVAETSDTTGANGAGTTGAGANGAGANGAGTSNPSKSQNGK